MTVSRANSLYNANCEYIQQVHVYRHEVHSDVGREFPPRALFHHKTERHRIVQERMSETRFFHTN